MGDDRNYGRRVRPILIVWIAMLASLPIYAAAGLLAAPNLPPVLNAAAFGLLRRVLYVAAAAMLLAVGRVRRLVRNSGAPSPGAERAAVPPARGETAVIVSLAMCESVAVIGLVLFLLGRNTTDLFLLLGVSAAAMVLHRPKAMDSVG